MPIKAIAPDIRTIQELAAATLENAKTYSTSEDIEAAIERSKSGSHNDMANLANVLGSNDGEAAAVTLDRLSRAGAAAPDPDILKILQADVSDLLKSLGEASLQASQGAPEGSVVARSPATFSRVALPTQADKGVSAEELEIITSAGLVHDPSYDGPLSWGFVAARATEDPWSFLGGQAMKALQQGAERGFPKAKSALERASKQIKATNGEY